LVGDYDNSDDPLDDHLLKEFTVEEVAKHNKRDDCWIIVKGNVYDCTGFDHPGGFNLILDYAGGDATPGFFG